MKIDIPNCIIEMIRDEIARVPPAGETYVEMTQRFAENSGRRKSLLQTVIDCVPVATQKRLTKQKATSDRSVP